MTDLLPSVSRVGLLGSELRPEQTAVLVNAVVAGGQFASTLTRKDFAGASMVFPVIDDISDPEWVPEFGVFPLLEGSGTPLVLTPGTLGGTILLPGALFDDLGTNTTVEARNALQAKFSAKLDHDLMAGSGQGPEPTGFLTYAVGTNADNLWQFAVRAKGEVLGAGGLPSHIAVNPADLTAEESRVDDIGRPLYPEGLAQLAGLTVVATPAATQALVYDSRWLYLGVSRNLTALLSDQYAPAFERRAVALRMDGRFDCGSPVANRAMRKWDVGNGDDGEATETSAAHVPSTTARPRAERP